VARVSLEVDAGPRRGRDAGRAAVAAGRDRAEVELLGVRDAEGLTAALAQDLPRGLAAVAFNPGVIDTDMLRVCFGDESAHYHDPKAWAATAVPFLAALTSADNGRSLTCPGH
jgi:hypothetical protein